MPTKILMPKLGMSMTEGRVVAWLTGEGDRVDKGTTILQIESDKIEYEVEAPASGVLARIYEHPSEEMVPVGQLLGVILAEGEELAEENLLIPQAPITTSAAARQFPDLGSRITFPSRPTSAKGERIKVSPAARKLAEEKGVEVSQVEGTGPGGRITREDVQAFLESQGAGKLQHAVVVSEGGKPALGVRIPMSRMRKIISQRLTASASQVPHIYLFSEVDAAALLSRRAELSHRIEEETHQRLSYNDLLIEAVARCIERHPLFNATLEGNLIVIPAEIHIGLAVAIEDGLIVPVIKQVRGKSLAQIVSARADLSRRAQTKKLLPDDLAGGTFTISNLGMYEVDYFTAIINPPQSAILSVGRMVQKPRVVEGQVAIRTVMRLGLAADHRVIDGALAAQFLQDLKRELETPILLC